MSDDRSGNEFEASAEEAEFTRLGDQASLQLRLNHLPTAQELVKQLLERWPESTTAHELAGDLALAQGKVAAARKEYQEAMRIEPANVDAERKYGLALVTRTPEEQRAALIDEVIADPKAHRASPRKPLNALLNSLLFPGLGQLYNREHEKGLVMLGGGAFLVMLAIYLLIEVPYSAAMESAKEHGLKLHEQLDRSQQALSGMGTGYWLLVVLVIGGFTALYVWGIYDAWREARSEAERLGVH